MASAVRRFLNFITGSRGPRKVTKHGRGERASNLTPYMPTYQDWDIPDVATALQIAETGNMQLLGRICDAFLGDGAIVGQLQTRFDGALQLPRQIEAAKAHQNGDGQPYRAAGGAAEKYAQALRDDFDTLCAPSELALIARDGGVANIMFGEILEDEDGTLRLVRRNPEFLTYNATENQWYVQTTHSREPVNPGDGRWLLHFPRGTDYPWRYGLWQALAFAYINRRQAFLNLNAWNNSLAFPIKTLTTPNAADEEEAQETFDAINHFGPFPAIRLNEGWEFDLKQPSQATPTSLKDAIETSEREVTLTVSGQSGTTDPGTGFSNGSLFAKVKANLIQGDMFGLATALNKQVIPVWAQRRFSFDGWFNCPRVEWNTDEPKDRTTEANAANTSAQAAKSWNEAFAEGGAPVRVDLASFAKHHGVPTIKHVAPSPAAPPPLPAKKPPPLPSVKKPAAPAPAKVAA